MLLLAVGLVVGMYYGYAKAISGPCSNCHTMHYSQNGGVLAGWGTAGPYEQLLVADCVSCHTGTTGATNTNTNAPAVYHTTAPTGQGPGSTLAGGDFYWVDAGSDSYGHNVIDLPNITGADANIGLTPPGWDPSATSTNAPTGYGAGQVASAGWTTQLTCAGAYGCHGYHQDPVTGTDLSNMGGIKGAHHSNNGTSGWTDGTTLGNSYRFLYGIQGYEDADWQWTADASDHNEYYGADDTTPVRQDDGTYTYQNPDTISFLCAQCHGIFHSEIDPDTTSGSPWVRHPTDIALPASGEYANYTSYSIEAPVGRTAAVTGPSATVTPGTDVVICLSCHRAHGSDQPDLLRWDYSTMQAGTTDSTVAGTGCFTCHTGKDGI